MKRIYSTQKNLPRQKKPSKPKREFSKVLAIVVLGSGILNLIVYHLEVLYAISLGSMALPDASIGTQTIITIFGGFTSYCLYQFGLKNSRNKYGVDADGQPYKTKPPPGTADEFTDYMEGETGHDIYT